MRFSLANGMISVTMLATACAAMTYRTPFWASVVVTVSFLLFAIMTVRAIALRGEYQAFALAFAIIGGGYLLLTTMVDFQIVLITNYPVAWAARALNIAPELLNGGGGFFSIHSELDVSLLSIQQFGGGGRSPISSLDGILDAAISKAPYAIELQKFFLIGHCVWSWLFGLLAGWSSAWLFRRASVTSAATL